MSKNNFLKVTKTNRVYALYRRQVIEAKKNKVETYYDLYTLE